MSKTWIVAANSAQARIFRYRGNDGGIEEKETLTRPAARAHDRELTTDDRGRMFDQAGPGRHAVGEAVSPSRHEAALFAARLAEKLSTARARDAYDRLILAAAPGFLGELTKRLDKPTSATIAARIDKDLTAYRPEEIGRRLPNAH